MSILDALHLLDVLEHWRFCLALALGGGAGLGVYYLAGRTPDVAAVAFVFLVVGIIGGTIWEIRHGRR